jgi:hypothetical protein
MTTDWAGYMGLTAGPWRLDSLMGVREGRAYFLSSDSEGSEKVLIQVILAEDPAAAAHYASWKIANGLSDHDIVRVYETAGAEFDGTPVYYSIQELPDDDLGELLDRRVLGAEQAQAVGAQLASGLNYLHQRGLRHGAVIPSNVLLTKDRAKLSADTIAPAANRADRETDIRQLGMTLVQAMTREADPAGVRRLPPLLRDVAVGCLAPAGRQWDAARVLRTLTPRSATPARQASTFEARPEETTGSLGSAGSAEATRRRLQYAGAAVFALVALLGYRVMKPSQPPVAQAGSRIEQPVRSATPPKLATPVPSPEAESKPSPIQPARPRTKTLAKPEVGVADRQGPPSWAVIAATYTDFDMAQKRAHQLEKLSPRLQAHVRPEAGQGTRYYVVLGSGLTHDAAEDLRRTARQSGAPDDTYVTLLKAQ